MSDVRYLLMHRKILTEAALFYHRQLLKLPKYELPWLYLYARGITEATVRKARLGYSNGSGLYEYLTAQGYLPSLIMQKNLCKMNKDKDLPYAADFFGRGRIIFPCLKEDRVVGMTSRICYETTNQEIPRYKMLGRSSYTFYSPDFVIKDDPLIICEGPFDVLILVQSGISACCFLGTSGFDESYADILMLATAIYGLPDREDNKQSRKANFQTYIQIHHATRKMPWIMTLPQGEGKGKVDPADYFKDKTLVGVRTAISRLEDSAVYLDETPEWKDHVRKLHDQRLKEQRKQKALEEGDVLEKFPIVPTLEKLGITVHTGYYLRPTCRCFNPDHEDTQPSVHIYEETQTFHCFGCNAGHDAIDAVRIVLGLNFHDAIDWLKENLYDYHKEKAVDTARSVQEPT